MLIGNRQFYLEDSVYIMGILNITPDSFSDGGRKDWNNLDSILERVEVMIGEGADIIDVGGQTTKIGYTEINESIEINRVVPAIRAIKSHFDIPISVDTYRAEVAIQAIRAGADMVNDIWGLKKDAKLAKVVATANVAYCLAHNCENIIQNNFIDEIITDLNRQITRALEAGIARDKIIIDPGISLGKSAEQNFYLLKKFECFQKIGFPILLGVSRKNFMNTIMESEPDQRIEMTIAANAISIIKGCSIIRVHDIKANKKALLMAQAIKTAQL